MNKKIKLFPLPLIIIYSLSALCAVIYFIFSLSPEFSDFVMTYIGTPIRFVLAKLTNILPFSLAECLLISLPLIITVCAYFAIKKYSDTWRNTGAYMLRALSILCCIWIIFALGFAGGYKGKPLNEKLGIERNKVTFEELKYTSELLRDKVNALASDVDFIPEGASVMPYSFSEMADKLNEAFEAFAEKQSFITHFKSRPKQVILSEPWTYTHISGVYTFFTGESNININFPEYTIPYTTAHEMAHQRGIAREDEANFVAFLVCAESSDPYIQYSGYLSLYEYVRSALYSASREEFSLLREEESAEIRGEMYSYSLFFDKYRENVAANVSGAINNTFLQSQGTPGTKSYGMVVDLAVAYFGSNRAK